MIGSIGFHGPPDDHGRLEVGCRIHPAHRGRGYGAEATTGLLDWATARFGVTRFLLAVPSRREGPDQIPILIAPRPMGRRVEDVDALAELLEGRLPRSVREGC
jgi:GNAT acetyltransferase-like protein